jgi:outer membrane protein OmpA-like peptidoglycan-associated protein
VKVDCRFQIAHLKSEISCWFWKGAGWTWFVSSRTLAALCVALPFVAGCTTPDARVQRIQAEKEQLLATIRQQRDANRDLQQQIASLETRLDQAETQLAGRKSRTVGQASHSSSVASSFATSHSQPETKNPAEEPLNWKPHRGFAQPTGALPTIAQIARQDDRVLVDPETGAGLWSEPVTFEPNSSALTPEGRAQLAELAKLLQRHPASKLRVLVATSAERTGSRAQGAAAKSGRNLATSRAQSVADYLDRHGIAEERLAIASTGVRKGPRDEHGRPAADEVRIYLVDPEQPVLGWLMPETIRR